MLLTWFLLWTTLNIWISNSYNVQPSNQSVTKTLSTSLVFSSSLHWLPVKEKLILKYFLLFLNVLLASLLPMLLTWSLNDPLDQIIRKVISSYCLFLSCNFCYYYVMLYHLNLAFEAHLVPFAKWNVILDKEGLTLLVLPVI